MLEWYEAYADYEDIATRLEELVAGGRRGRGLRRSDRLLPRGGGSPCARRSASETGVDVLATRDRDALVAAARENGIELEPAQTWAKLVEDDLLTKHVEPELQQPTFILDYPRGAVAVREGPPLRARARRALRVLRAGIEFANAFSELNDPDEQRARFEQQARRRRRRRGNPAVRRRLRPRARARDAADRRHRHGHRQTGDDSSSDAGRFARSSRSFRPCARSPGDRHGSCRPAQPADPRPEAPLEI